MDARNGGDPQSRVPSGGSDARGIEDFLERVPILSALGAEAREELGGGAETVMVPAGETLFRRGDPGDALYLVRSGRLEAVADRQPASGTAPQAPQPETIRVLQRGDCVGELALLTEAPRSATVVARRDSALLRIDRERFDRLLDDPGFVRGLLRGLGERLRMSRGLPTSNAGPPMVVAVVGDGSGASVRGIAEGLRERMAQWSAVATLHPDDFQGSAGAAVRAMYAQRLDSIERTGARALLVADDSDDGREWRGFAVQQADRVVAVTRCQRMPRDLPELVGCDLLLELGAGSGPVEPWIAGIRPRTTYRVSARRRAADLDRVARRLSGRALGVVLSGGGARGFAHIGALEVLTASGVEIDRVSGCSMGAIVGGLFASGRSPEEIHAICQAEFVERNPLGDYTLPVAGLVRGQRAEAMVTRMFGERRIEEFPLSFFCVTSDLISGESIVHRSGIAYRLIGASASLPGIIPPVSEEERLLVDGGVLNNLPVEQMAATGEGPVVAVDVTARFDAAGAPRRSRPRTRRLAARARETVVGVDDPLPSIRETVIRSVVLGSIDTAAAAQAHADAVLEPGVEGFGMTEFAELDRIVAAGRDAARARIEDIEALAQPQGLEWPPTEETSQGKEDVGAHDHAA